VIEDLRAIFGHRCGLKPQNMSTSDVWANLVAAYTTYCKREMNHTDVLIGIFKPRWNEKEFHSKWFVETCPLTRAIGVLLSQIMILECTGKDGEVILNLGKPNPDILPLKD